MLAGLIGSEEVVMAFLNCKLQQEQEMSHRILGSALLPIQILEQN